MADRLSQVHVELGEIRQALDRLERRLAALEQRGSRTIARDVDERAADEIADTRARPAGGGAGTVFALAGRGFLAFGGAFVLRALTESGVIGPTTGVWLGVSYAVAWIAAAEWTSGATRLLHGWLSLAIGLPLVLEAAGRLELLSVGAGVAALTLVCGLALGVAWHRQLPSLAAGVSVGGSLVALVLGLATSRLLPYAAFGLALGIGSLWVSYACRWRWLLWPSAAATNLLALVAALRACHRPPLESPIATEALLAAFGALYFGSFIVRTLFHERAVRGFETAQTAAVMAVGLGGAILVGRLNGLDVAAVGLPAAIVGIALYAQTFWRVAARRGYGGDFHYFGFTAFGLTLAGATLLLPAPARLVVTAAAALALAALAARLQQSPLLLQSAIALVVAAAEAHLFPLLAALWLGPVPVWPSIPGAVVFVLVTGAACYLPRQVTRVPRDAFSVSGRVMMAGILAAGAACVALAFAGPVFAGRPASAGVLATVRTVILAASVAVLARIGRAVTFRELAWIAYVLLIVCGAKILLDDLPHSRATTLFIALAAYGLALIATPRLATAPAVPIVPSADQPRDGRAA